jgi:hypothetical protein
MPTSVETPKSLLKWCPDPRCRGNAQTAAAGIVVETSWTYKERGGDMPGIEMSKITFRFANPEDANCKICGRNAEISDQVRPVYESLSGFPQDQLLHIDRWNPDKAGEVEALVDRLTEKLNG